MAGFVYLVVAGSMVGYTAYTYLNGKVSPQAASSYAYVNPLAAVLLGWAFVGETITPTTLLAGGLIVVAVVALLAGDRRPSWRAARAPSPAATEAEVADPSGRLNAAMLPDRRSRARAAAGPQTDRCIPGPPELRRQRQCRGDLRAGPPGPRPRRRLSARGSGSVRGRVGPFLSAPAPHRGALGMAGRPDRRASGGQSIGDYAGLPLGTWLILHNQPVRAALLRGSTASMILTGAAVRTSGLGIWVALLAPLLITMCTDPCFFYGGRRYGRALIQFLDAAARAGTGGMARGSGSSPAGPAGRCSRSGDLAAQRRLLLPRG